MLQYPAIAEDSIHLERGMEDCKITKPANSTVKPTMRRYGFLMPSEAFG